jgi:transcriptional regulator with XRE-family HTH domain
LLHAHRKANNELKKWQEMILETGLQLLREELRLSQKNVAELMGVSQPAVTQIEQRGNELKLPRLSATLRQWVGNFVSTLNFPQENELHFISNKCDSCVK